MKPISNKVTFLDNANTHLLNMIEVLEKVPVLKLDELDPEATGLIIVDINNGFAKAGALYSKNVENLIPGIENLAVRCAEKDIFTVAYSDNHTKKSPELEAYPEHCMGGTKECELIDELARIPKIITVYKNSINGFLAANPYEMTAHRTKERLSYIKTWIIVGDCTDICVSNLSQTLKAYLNEKNVKARVIVPIELVDTYDAPWHNADLANVVLLNNMADNGIELVKTID